MTIGRGNRRRVSRLPLTAEQRRRRMGLPQFLPPPSPLSPFQRQGKKRKRGGGGEEAAWSEEGMYEVAGAPDWWIGKIPPIGGKLTPDSAYAAIVNSIIPYLSPEDQRAAANSLAQTLPDVFGGYADVEFEMPPLDVTPAMRQEFTSAARAEGLLNALETMREASTFEKESFGPGFTYFETLAKTLRDFGGTEESPMSRSDIRGLRGALDPLLAQTSADELSAFGPISQAIAQPFFSAGDIHPVTRLPSGEYIFGERNPEFF